LFRHLTVLLLSYDEVCKGVVTRSNSRSPNTPQNNVEADLANPCSRLMSKERSTRGGLRRREESPSCFSKGDLFIVRSPRKTLLLQSSGRKLAVWAGTSDLRLACQVRSIWRTRGDPRQETRQAIRCLPVPPCQAGPHPEAAQSVHCRFMRCHL
jgi:hypothetical protein